MTSATQQKPVCSCGSELLIHIVNNIIETVACPICKTPMRAANIKPEGLGSLAIELVRRRNLKAEA